jgi:hypothetical protein
MRRGKIEMHEIPAQADAPVQPRGYGCVTPVCLLDTPCSHTP